MTQKNKVIEGKTAIVTGASRGIGKAIAFDLAAAGAHVVVVARTIECGGLLKGTIYETVSEIEKSGGQATAIQANVVDETSIESMVKQVIDQLGYIDILVNNAGTNIPCLFKDLTMKQWDIITKVTLRGTIVCSKAAIPHMITQKYGHIINISSVAAKTINIPLTGLAYDVSKTGINRFSWGLANELRQYNIAVNALMPANTTTEGWSLLNPDADKTEWQTPELWGQVVTSIASQEPSRFTGKVMTIEDVRQEIRATDWEI